MQQDKLEFQINLPISGYRPNLRTRKHGDRIQIWGFIRKKWFILTKEEMVRQLLIHYLIEEHKYPANRFGVEKSIQTLNMTKRFDILIYDDQLNPWMLVECKSPEWKIDQSTFNQIGVYNVDVKAPYLLITNGNVTLCAKISRESGEFKFLKNIPLIEKKP